MNEKLATRLIVGVTTVVTIVWVIVFLAPFFVRGYQPPQEVHYAFMGVVGILVRLSFKATQESENSS